VITVGDFVIIERCPHAPINGHVLEVLKISPRNGTVTVLFEGEETPISRAYCRKVDPPAQELPPPARQAIDQVIDSPKKPANPFKYGDRVVYEGDAATVLGGVTGQPGHVYFKFADESIGTAHFSRLQAAPAEPEPPADLIAPPLVDSELVLTLKDLEEEIQEGLGQIAAGRQRVWLAAAQIRDRALWQEAGYSSFEGYCKGRWGWERTNSHDNARAGDLLADLMLSGIPDSLLPTSVSQALELAKVEPEHRAEVIDRALEESGQMTAAALRQAAATVTGQSGATNEQEEARRQVAALEASLPTFQPGDRAWAAANLQDPPEGRQVAIQSVIGFNYYQTDHGKRHASQLKPIEEKAQEAEAPKATPAQLTPKAIEEIAQKSAQTAYEEITHRYDFDLTEVAQLTLEIEDAIREVMEAWVF